MAAKLSIPSTFLNPAPIAFSTRHRLSMMSGSVIAILPSSRPMHRAESFGCRRACSPRPVAPGQPVGTFVADAQTYHRWYRPNASLYFTPEGFEAYYQQPRPKVPGT